MANDERIIIEDPRVIYSLSMTAILYELYKSDFFTSSDSLAHFIKSIFSILLIAQMVFLFIRGLLLADIGDNHKERLLYISNSVYASGFQLSIIFFIIGFYLFIASKVFDFLSIPIVPLTKMIFILINLGVVIMAVYLWKMYFFQNNNRPTNSIIYTTVILWTSVMIVIFVLL